MIAKQYIYSISFFLLFFTACKSTQSSSKNWVLVDKTNEKKIGNNQVKAERIFFSGQKEKLKENYKAALLYFEQAVKLYPKIDAAWFEMARINILQQDYKTALVNMKKALELSPENTWYREFMGELYSVNQQFGEAEKIFASLRKDFPYNDNYYYDHAYFLLKQNKFDEALKIYDALEKQNEGIQEKVSIEKYKVYLRQNNIEDAENELQKIADTFPEENNHLIKLAKFQLQNQKEEKAVANFKKVLSKDPNNTIALMNLADYYKTQGNEKEYKHYSKQAFSNPNIAIDAKIAVLYNSISQYQEGEIDTLTEAYEYVQQLVNTHPENAKSWAIYGDIYNLDQKPKQAIRCYKKSLEYQQDIFSVWQQLFFLQSDENLLDDLIKSTEEAKTYFPNQALIYYCNGIAHQQQKNYTQAIVAYEDAIKMVFKNDLMKAQIYSSLGECYHKLANYEKSDKNFDKSINLNPNNQYTLNNYSYYLALRGKDLERAKLMSKKSLEISPDNPTYLDTYAWILFKNKEIKEALKIQIKAIELSKEPSQDMFDHLGDIYMENKQPTEAKKYWQKAIDAGGDAEVIGKKINDL